MVKKIASEAVHSQHPVSQAKENAKLQQQAKELSELVRPQLGAGKLPSVSEKIVNPKLADKTTRVFKETDLSTSVHHVFSKKAPKEAKVVKEATKNLF